MCSVCPYSWQMIGGVWQNSFLTRKWLETTFCFIYFVYQFKMPLLGKREKAAFNTIKLKLSAQKSTLPAKWTDTGHSPQDSQLTIRFHLLISPFSHQIGNLIWKLDDELHSNKAHKWNMKFPAVSLSWRGDRTGISLLRKSCKIKTWKIHKTRWPTGHEKFICVNSIVCKYKLVENKKRIQGIKWSSRGMTDSGCWKSLPRDDNIIQPKVDVKVTRKSNQCCLFPSNEIKSSSLGSSSAVSSSLSHVTQSCA